VIELSAEEGGSHVVVLEIASRIEQEPQRLAYPMQLGRDDC